MKKLHYFTFFGQLLTLSLILFSTIWFGAAAFSSDIETGKILNIISYILFLVFIGSIIYAPWSAIKNDHKSINVKFVLSMIGSLVGSGLFLILILVSISAVNVVLLFITLPMFVSHIFSLYSHLTYCFNHSR